jgi:hypothetical protein
MCRAQTKCGKPRLVCLSLPANRKTPKSLADGEPDTLLQSSAFAARQWFALAPLTSCYCEPLYRPTSHVFASMSYPPYREPPPLTACHTTANSEDQLLGNTHIPAHGVRNDKAQERNELSCGNADGHLGAKGSDLGTSIPALGVVAFLQEATLAGCF